MIMPERISDFLMAAIPQTFPRHWPLALETRRVIHRQKISQTSTRIRKDTIQLCEPQKDRLLVKNIWKESYLRRRPNI